MAKYLHVANLLENRIRHGDYFLKEMPSERELAVEVQVSHMTARKAIQRLVQKGLLVRASNKRVVVNRRGRESKKRLGIALLAPAFPNPYLEQWHQWVEEMSAERGCFVRSIGYCHWDDAVLTDTIEGFDGTFIFPMSEEYPEWLIERIRQSGKPVVTLCQDLTGCGIPSLRLTSPEMVQKLLDHLGDLGHRKIDCLNTQALEQVGYQRIEQWQLWLAAHGGQGRLINEPVKLFRSPMEGAYSTVKRCLNEGGLTGTAMFCVTSSSAVGAMRAIREHGLTVGKDISVCAAEDGADMAPYLTPSLTCLKDRDPRPYLGVCLDWMVRGGKDWIGPLLVQPGEATVFAGESTGEIR